MLFLILSLALSESWEDLSSRISRAGSGTVYNQIWREAADASHKHLQHTLRQLGLPSISIAVGVKGELVWAGALGYADLEKNIQASPQTRYRIGSTSKAVTATGLARLYEQGLIDLDKPIHAYLPEFPEKQHPITARQLASHTSGLVGYENNGLSFWYKIKVKKQRFYSVYDSLVLFRDAPLKFEPGTDFHYTTYGTVLLSAVMEGASGRSYFDLMHEEVFKPLGMSRTGADRAGIPGRAVFYRCEKERITPWEPVDLSYKWAGGGLCSTPTDLVRMGNALTSGNFLKKATLDEFWRPVILSGGSENKQQYALGWRSHTNERHEQMFEGRRTFRIVHHGGISKGSQCFLLLFPDQQLVLAMMINGRSEAWSWWDFARNAYPIAEHFISKISDSRELD